MTPYMKTIFQRKKKSEILTKISGSAPLTRLAKNGYAAEVAGSKNRLGQILEFHPGFRTFIFWNSSISSFKY